MTTQTRTPSDIHDHVAREGRDTAPSSGADAHGRLGAVLTHLGVLAALTEPEALIALANGVPNLDDDTLVRFLYDSRTAA
jgi:hypothetical protein